VLGALKEWWDLRITHKYDWLGKRGACTHGRVIRGSKRSKKIPYEVVS